jgi:hypothetical protein
MDLVLTLDSELTSQKPLPYFGKTYLLLVAFIAHTMSDFQLEGV